MFMSTPQNPSDLKTLLDIGIPAIKIGSDDCSNHDMLIPVRDAAAAHKIPVIWSIGMATRAEVLDTFELFRYVDQLPMVCTSQYPCYISELRLLRGMTFSEWGFSDHTTYPSNAHLVALGAGACVFEKHFFVSTKIEDSADDLMSLKEYVKEIREAEKSLGYPNPWKLSAREKESRSKWKRFTGNKLRGEPRSGQ